MNKILIQACFVLLAVLAVTPLQRDTDSAVASTYTARSLGIDYDYVYCQAGDHAVDRHVPKRDFRDLLAKGGGTLGDFEVNYTGFTSEARAAFQYAVDIWDMFLDSDVKIVVDANFADLNSGVLGSAAPTAMYVNFSHKVDRDIEFAAPLAEKIAGVSLNGTDADLRCNFSNSINWFYDVNNTDNIASNQHDFATVVLHELGHGLGFLSRHAYATADRIGSIRGEAPVLTDIFSLLLERGDGTNLLLELEEGSEELGVALTAADLFLNTHSFTGATLPKIFAPSPWQGGSSLSHLDENTFNTTDPLMTPSISANEIIHDPEIALDMMQDMGWRSSFIAHRAENTELVGAPLPISAHLYTDEGVGFDSSSVLLIYSQDSFRLSSNMIVMEPIDGGSEFQGELPAGNTSGLYQYYITIDDAINKGYSSPLLAPRRYHNVQIGVDNVAPNIEHTPLDYYFLNENNPLVTAEVTDAFMGVDSVEIEYRLNGGNLSTVGLSNTKFDQYEMTLVLQSLNPSGGDMVEYRLKATDNATAKNTTYAPESGFYAAEVKDVPSVVEFYQNDFEGSNIDFSNNGFSIQSASGFDGSGMHSEHPYQNAGAGNELNFIATLRVPIKVVENGEITFDEVVLVEPGSAGSNFGDADFWDYVIVEVSKIDDGSTWIPLTDGYDSQAEPSWNGIYNAGLSGQNSSSEGNKNFIKNRSIKLHQPALGINTGDVVAVRWRLFSDPFAVGWGWMIDNLIIQENATPTITFDHADALISIFPNPVVTDVLDYEVIGNITIRNTTIADINGRLLMRSDHQTSANDSRQLDVSQLTPGLYFVIFQTDKYLVSKRFLKL